MVCSLGNAQKTKKAERSFDDHPNTDALVSYDNLVKKGYSDIEIFEKLGDDHYTNAEYREAGAWYEKLFALENAEPDSEYIYRYAMSLKAKGNYGESDRWMQKFNESKVDDSRGQRFMANPDYLYWIKERSGRSTVKKLPVNSRASDFAPSFYKEGLVFSSARDTGLVFKHVDAKNNLPFQKLYVSEITENGELAKTVKFSQGLDSKAHESTTAFSKDGNTPYFTRNNFGNGNFKRGDQGFSRHKIYRAQLQKGRWRNITELPFCNDGYSVAHPALSADGTKLYFASDMPGTLGASDLYSVDIADDGSFGPPQNLGRHINTEGRETFPHISDTGILYFASDGHPGLGGLDIFAIGLNDLQNGCIINLGEPINSGQDDFGVIMNEASQKGYFASNRDGGLGMDDLYSFTRELPLEMVCTGLVTDLVRDEETGTPLIDAKIMVLDSGGTVLIDGSTKNNGTFHMQRRFKSGQYNLVTTKKGYKKEKRTFFMDKNNGTVQIEQKLVPIKRAAPPGTDLIAYLNIRPVNFDFDKSVIGEDAEKSLSRIVAYMKTFPKTRIEIRSHTDASAGPDYNLKLSKERAKATVEHLVSLGVDASRLVGKGFGETRLLNYCTTREKCPDKEHRLNRRSEFIVVE